MSDGRSEIQQVYEFLLNRMVRDILHAVKRLMPRPRDGVTCPWAVFEYATIHASYGGAASGNVPFQFPGDTTIYYAKVLGAYVPAPGDPVAIAKASHQYLIAGKITTP